MENTQTHRIVIGSAIRHLPIERPPSNPTFRVAVFDMLGDVELVMMAGGELYKLVPREVEALVMPFGKAVALLHEIGHLTGLPTVVARKEKRFYMKDVVSVGGVQSVTTERVQEYHLNGVDVEHLRGKKVAFIDDVISTGGSLRSLRELLHKINAELVAVMAVFTEGDTPHEGVISLGHLPLFHDK